jgi:hypothetical protein
MKLNSSIRLTIVLLVLTVTGPTFSGAAEAKRPVVNPTGTWKWTAPANPDGRIPDITFILNLQGGTLTGAVTKSSSTTTITNGVVKGDEISFQTLREGKAGKSTTTYTGKLTSDTIKGKVEIGVGDRRLQSDWEAKRVKE